MSNLEKKEKTKAPDFLSDVIFAVKDMDDLRLKKRTFEKETLETLHAKAVKAIVLCNNVHGKGYISVSKAREIIASLYRLEKVGKEEKLNNHNKKKKSA